MYLSSGNGVLLHVVLLSSDTLSVLLSSTGYVCVYRGPHSSTAPHKRYGDLDNDLLAALLFASKYGAVGGLLLPAFFGDVLMSNERLRAGETLRSGDTVGEPLGGGLLESFLRLDL